MFLFFHLFCSLTNFLWQYNYGGIQAKFNGGSLDADSEPSSANVHGDSQVDIVASWNTAENLPKEIQVNELLIYWICIGLLQ